MSERESLFHALQREREAAMAHLSEKLRKAPNDAHYMQVVVGFHDLARVLDYLNLLDAYSYQLEGYVDEATREAVQASVIAARGE